MSKFYFVNRNNGMKKLSHYYAIHVRAEIYDGSKHFLKYFLSKFETRESRINNLKYLIFYFKIFFSLLHYIFFRINYNFLMQIYLLTLEKKMNPTHVFYLNDRQLLISKE